MGLENIREIKFRYVCRYGQTKTVHTFVRTLNHIETAKDFPILPYQIIAKNQYINMKDMDGEELYEHDVVTIIPTLAGKKGIVGVIRWRYGAFIVEPFTNTATSNTYYYIHYGRLKRLGDIYHNSDMKKILEKSKCSTTDSKKATTNAGN